MSKLLILVAALATPALIVPCHAMAQSTGPGKLRGAITVGTNIYGGSTLHGGGVATQATLRSFNSDLPNVPAVITILEKKFSDAYDPAIEYGLEISYGLNETTEMYGSISYSQTDRAYLQIGSTTVAALNANLPTFAEFGAIKDLRADIGARYFFGTGAFRPFVGGSIGVMRQDAMNINILIPSAPLGGIALRNVPFFKQTTSVTAAVEAGISADFSERLAARLSVGARYVPAFRDEDRGLNTLNLGSINNGSSRILFPVKASISSSF